MTSTAQQREWLTPAEIQEMVGLGRTTVYSLISQRKLPAVRLGRAVRVHRSDVERYLESNRY